MILEPDYTVSLEQRLRDEEEAQKAARATEETYAAKVKAKSASKGTPAKASPPMALGRAGDSSTPRGAPVAGPVGTAGGSSTPRGAPVVGGAGFPPSPTPGSSPTAIKVEDNEETRDDLKEGRNRHARRVDTAIRQLRLQPGPKRPDAFIRDLVENDEADRLFLQYGPTSHDAFVEQVTAMVDPAHSAATHAIDLPLQADVSTAASLKHECRAVLPV